MVGILMFFPFPLLQSAPSPRRISVPVLVKEEGMVKTSSSTNNNNSSSTTPSSSSTTPSSSSTTSLNGLGGVTDISSNGLVDTKHSTIPTTSSSLSGGSTLHHNHHHHHHLHHPHLREATSNVTTSASNGPTSAALLSAAVSSASLLHGAHHLGCDSSLDPFGRSQMGHGAGGVGGVPGGTMAFGGSFPGGMPPLHHNNNAYLHHQRAW